MIGALALPRILFTGTPFKPIIAAAAVVVAVGGIGYGVHTAGIGSGGGSSGGPLLSNLFVDSNGGSCTRSSTRIAWSDSTACSAFDVACRAASAGDLIGVEPSGSYAGQTLDATSFRSHGCSSGTLANPITFENDYGTVTIASFTAGDANSGSAGESGASNFIIRNVEGNWEGGTTFDLGRVGIDNSQNVTLLGVNAKNGLFSGGSNNAVNYSNLRNCTADASNPACNWKVQRFDPNGNGTGQASNITFDHDYFHSAFTVDASLYHSECLVIFSGGSANTDNIVISNNKFEECSVFDVFYQGTRATNTKIENNWFARPLAGNYPSVSATRSQALAFSSDTATWDNALIRNNSFANGAGGSWNDNGNTNAYTNFRVTGNIFGDNYCGSNSINFSYNVFPSSTCSGTGNVNRGGAAPNYVTDSNDSSFNLRLTGSNSFADNLVPCGTAPGGCPASDIFGTSRPQNTNADSGSYERNQ